MSKEDFGRLIEECRSALGLAYSPGVDNGTTAVLAGMLAFLPLDLVARVRAAINELPQGFSIPSVRIDPLGFALAARAFCQPIGAEIMAKIRNDELDDQALLASLPWNLYHVVLGTMSLRLLSHTCVLNCITGRKHIVNDVALVHRLRQQSFHVALEPRPLTQPLPSVDEFLRSSLALVEFVRPKIVICSNWRKPHISRRSSKRVVGDAGQRNAISIRLLIPKAISARLIQAAQEEEERDQALVEASRERNLAHERGLGARMKKSRPPDEAFSALPPRRGVTESQLARIRQYGREKYATDPGALGIALLDACAVGDSDLANMRLLPTGGGYLIATPCPLLTLRDRQGTALHVPVTDEFIRPIPTPLAQSLKRAMDSNWTNRLLEARSRCFEQKFSTTSAKVRHAMRFQAPVWCGMPWAFYDLGLVPVRFDEHGHARMPGYRHYLTSNPAGYDAWIANALDELGWKVSTEGDVIACGSANTPSLVTVREMVRCLESLVMLVKAKSRMNRLETIALINAISALARLFECLFTFTRNYPCPPARIMFDDGRPVIMDTIIFRQEKIRLRPVVYTSCLVSMLESVAGAFYFLCRSLEADGHRFVCEEGAPEWSSSAFGFIEGTGKTLRLSNSRKTLIRSGLLHHPATENFGAIDPNCMRNLAYYLLATHPKHQFSVMTFCDHFPNGSGGALSRNSGASIIPRPALESACNDIAKAILCPWLS